MLARYTLDPVIALCHRHRFNNAARWLSDFKAQPIQHFWKLCQYPLGWLPGFHFYGLNPTSISAEQANHAPILFLHGNYDNQSAGLAIAKHMQRTYPGVMFTVNLYSGRYCEKDFDIIEKKIVEIKKMYAEHDKKNIIIHLIGHSRGATIACYVALDRKCWKIENGVFEITPEMKEKMRMIVYRDDIGKVALLSGGTYPVSYNTHQFIRDKFCSIMGDNDGYLLFGDRDVRVRSRHSLVPSDKSTCLSLATFFKKHTGSTATVEFGGEVEETYPQHCVIQ